MTRETIPPRCAHWDEDDDGAPTTQCRATATHHSCCYYSLLHVNACFKHRCRCRGQRSPQATNQGNEAKENDRG